MSVTKGHSPKLQPFISFVVRNVRQYFPLSNFFSLCSWKEAATWWTRPAIQHSRKETSNLAMLQTCRASSLIFRAISSANFATTLVNLRSKKRRGKSFDPHLPEPCCESPLKQFSAFLDITAIDNDRFMVFPVPRLHVLMHIE